MKKRKLNSNNPKYKTKKEEAPKIRKEFVQEIKGVKISKIFYI